MEEERIIINPTEQELLWAKQHSQWLYDKHEVDDSTEMQQTVLRIKSMKECLRLSQDDEIKSIERKTSTLEKDTKEQSDAEEQHEEYNAPLIVTEKIDKSKRTTRSVTRLRSRNFPEPTTLSDV